MTASSPTKYVKRGDPEYQKLPWYQLALIPGKQGSTVNDYRHASNTLRAALESKGLSESVPHTPANGRELILDFLREEVPHIISQNDLGWVRGCDSLLVRYHPAKREKLTSILSHLPLSADGRKLLSVHNEKETFASHHTDLDSISLGVHSFHLENTTARSPSRPSTRWPTYCTCGRPQARPTGTPVKPQPER